MQKPNNYENTAAAGEFTPIELGGHYLVIKQVEEIQSKSGIPMIKISFDTADTDRQPHYFADQFRADIWPDKKWPANGVMYMTTEDANKNCTRNFKGFTTSAERSNPGFTIQWGDSFCACLKNKLIGGVFREELGVYNGRETHQHKLAWFCSNEKVADAAVPDVYETKKHKDWAAGGSLNSPMQQADTGFMNIPDSIDDELPFA